MNKGKGEKVKDRYWWRGPNETRKALAKYAIDLDTSVEKLAGQLLSAVVAQAHGDVEVLRKLLGRK